MASDDLTLQVLVEIRDEIRNGFRETNQRIDSTNERLDGTNERLDGTNQRLDRVDRRIVESEIRLATAVTDLAGTLYDVQGRLKTRGDLRERVERCEHEIDELKKRLT